jgi:hypothetical protein
MRIAFIMQGPAQTHPLWSAVGRRLAERGATVEFLFFDAGVTDLGPRRTSAASAGWLKAA